MAKPHITVTLKAEFDGDPVNLLVSSLDIKSGDVLLLSAPPDASRDMVSHTLQSISNGLRSVGLNVLLMYIPVGYTIASASDEQMAQHGWVRAPEAEPIDVTADVPAAPAE